MEGKRIRHSRGSITLHRRRSGAHVWMFRYKATDGSRPGFPFATIKDCRTPSEARIEADRQRLPEKYVTPATSAREGRKTFAQLVTQYRKEEIPERYSTKHSYESWLSLHIDPKWGPAFIDAVEPADVEQWLKGLELAPKSKSHIKGLMTILFNCAMKWKWIPLGRNPMELVRIKGASRRRARPDVVSREQFAHLFRNLEHDYLRVLVVVGMCLGPRLSEILALKWEDVDFDELTMSVRRGIVQGRIGDVKTEYSDADLVLDEDLADVLSEWREKSDFAADTDWIFASPFQAGELPYFPTGVRRKIHAAAKAAGLGELFAGEPTKIMRHSYRSWLGATNAPIGVIKDLMRHADVRTTMNTYGNGLEKPMRKAHSKVVRMVLKPGRARVKSVSRKLSS